ncbi:hypothetical protein [Falsiroseomonas oryzae]|uniref:hypothetical protein n=1 Tax=Falsiroseomonas oryzae TaxID=2766473 RepID=UPI0022EA98E9|nr:hypothetical protein [Roseomonas sp. MO-31]
MLTFDFEREGYAHCNWPGFYDKHLFYVVEGKNKYSDLVHGASVNKGVRNGRAKPGEQKGINSTLAITNAQRDELFSWLNNGTLNKQFAKLSALGKNQRADISGIPVLGVVISQVKQKWQVRAGGALTLGFKKAGVKHWIDHFAYHDWDGSYVVGEGAIFDT